MSISASRQGGNPEPNTEGLSREAPIGGKRFADLELVGHVFIVTGGARGLGLALAEALVEAGAKVYCFDKAASPDQKWNEALERVVPEWGGHLEYRQVDVQDTPALERLIGAIAEENGRLDGAVAAAGIQQIKPACEYTPEQADKILKVNYTAVLMTASITARKMMEYKCHGSICLVASMSGSVANKGLISPVYNSSKAAVIQLARNLAMEWSPLKEDGTGGIRVNSLSPGHILTPMVLKNLEEVPGLKEKWARENMMGRLATTSEFKGAGLFLLSKASSFMTGSNLVVDGGHTAW
ncbi:D-arabinitol 2-dehydrogenase [ribulose-forming]-like protein [Emericellopsis cladophorae]|uniref:D-arabinitol 2-dehydrogenase [ribulose-forming]-like protein n=1 Tax=Emericellopsis cladophorae TaxID=2686198 RepID=A0A9P9Y0Z7_9HYPO|nr:D-arabinitol 2-dehydrogenase [ribulose-forming]-like protein [Emericellopsis cladophorae]KAI6780959.1 D-arabinitol 2-dehydrogenase [ribulose-forming]-like protein [Emericellopsis cladophorae]